MFEVKECSKDHGLFKAPHLVVLKDGRPLGCVHSKQDGRHAISEVLEATKGERDFLLAEIEKSDLPERFSFRNLVEGLDTFLAEGRERDEKSVKFLKMLERPSQVFALANSAGDKLALIVDDFAGPTYVMSQIEGQRVLKEQVLKERIDLDSYDRLKRALRKVGLPEKVLLPEKPYFALFEGEAYGESCVVGMTVGTRGVAVVTFSQQDALSGLEKQCFEKLIPFALYTEIADSIRDSKLPLENPKRTKEVDLGDGWFGEVVYTCGLEFESRVVKRATTSEAK